MSRIKEVEETIYIIDETVNQIKDILSAEQQRDAALGFIVSLLKEIDMSLAIIADNWRI